MAAFLRLVHVSDLHFGATFATPWLWEQTVAGIPGLGEHSAQVAHGLSDVVSALRLPAAPPVTRIVATGDLTTWGTAGAFSLALTFLRGQVFAGNPDQWVGFQDPALPVVPGNHDAWNGAVLGLWTATLPPAARGGFAQYFGFSAVGAAYPPGTDGGFPYRLPLTAPPDPVVYLYGLDSTRVDQTSWPAVRNCLADGFVDAAQLAALTPLVETEATPADVRIAILHNPLAYPDSQQTPRTHRLLNLYQVVGTLQNLGFALALSGHLHHGFVRNIPYPAPSSRRLGVLNAGTATQAVRLTGRERGLLRRDYATLTPATQNEWKRAAAKCNEFRTYDLEVGSNPPVLTVTIQRYRYDLRILGFGRNPHQEQITLPL